MVHVTDSKVYIYLRKLQIIASDVTYAGLLSIGLALYTGETRLSMNVEKVLKMNKNNCHISCVAAAISWQSRSGMVLA